MKLEENDFDFAAELHKPKNKTITIRLPKGSKGKLARIARSKGLNVSALTRMWLTEKLQSSH